MSQFYSGMMWTAGAACTLLCIFAIGMLCELIAKLTDNAERKVIKNGIVEHATALCMLSERMDRMRSEQNAE